MVEAQSAAGIDSAPHHRLLLQNEKVRVFEVLLPRSEQTIVRHNHNFLVITLQDAEIVMWPEGRADVQNFTFAKGDVRFFLGEQTIGLRNQRADTYRNITVEFLDPKVTTYNLKPQKGEWKFGDSVLPPPTNSRVSLHNDLEMGAGIATFVQLTQGDSWPPPEDATAELLIPVSDVDFRVGLDLHLRKSSGQAFSIPAGRKDKFINANADPVQFVVIVFPEAK